MSVEEWLHQAAERINTELDRTPIPTPPNRVRTPWRAALATAAVTLIAVGSVVWLLGPGADREVTTRAVTTVPPPTTVVEDDGTLFGEASGVVLLFDDGIDGVLAVDPDDRVAARSLLDGQRPGDQSPRLHRTGDHLIVGWGEITAIDVVNGETTPLGSATTFVPSVVRGRVWLVDYGRGRPDQRVAQVRQVVVESGKVLSGPVAVEHVGIAPRGIRNGLIFETSDGVAIWRFGDEAPRGRLGAGEGTGFVVDAWRDRVGWCTGDCETITVTDLAGGDTVFDAGPYDPGSGRFSPSGRSLAVSANGSIQILDMLAREAVEVGNLGAGEDPAPLFLGWSSDGEQLFASTNAYGERTMEILRYRLADQRLDTVTLPFGGALDFLVLDPDEAGRFLDSGDTFDF